MNEGFNSLESRISEINKFLLIAESNLELYQLIEEYYESDDLKIDILECVISFINKFKMFKDIDPFMKAVHYYIKKALEYKPTSVEELDYLLVKITIKGLFEEYQKISQGNQVSKYLTDSLEKLDLQPLIINLGLLLKPMYQDENSCSKTKAIEESRFIPASDEEKVRIIKNSIDKWLQNQFMDLYVQTELKALLKDEYRRLTAQYHILDESPLYSSLFVEVSEMLTLKFTVISLMDSLSEESFEPVPIK